MIDRNTANNSANWLWGEIQYLHDKYGQTLPAERGNYPIQRINALIEELKHAAEAGNNFARERLGSLYYNGLFHVLDQNQTKTFYIKPDPIKAEAFYAQAALAQHYTVLIHARLGKFQEQKDIHLAYKAYQIAEKLYKLNRHEQSDYESHTNLGILIIRFSTELNCSVNTGWDYLYKAKTEIDCPKAKEFLAHEEKKAEHLYADAVQKKPNALTELEKQAKAGNWFAAYQMGMFFLKEKNNQKAMGYLKIAARRQHPAAYCYLGFVNQLLGRFDQADACYLRAMTLGDPLAPKYWQALIKERAKELYPAEPVEEEKEKPVAKPDPEELYKLGLEAEGRKDWQQAFVKYEEAAEKKSTKAKSKEALFRMGILLQNHPKIFQEWTALTARRCFFDAAMDQHDDALNQLYKMAFAGDDKALIYLLRLGKTLPMEIDGQEVEWNNQTLAEKYNAASSVLLSRAQQGDPEALYWHGLIFHKGLLGNHAQSSDDYVKETFNKAREFLAISRQYDQLSIEAAEGLGVAKLRSSAANQAQSALVRLGTFSVEPYSTSPASPDSGLDVEVRKLSINGGT